MLNRSFHYSLLITHLFPFFIDFNMDDDHFADNMIEGSAEMQQPDASSHHTHREVEGKVFFLQFIHSFIYLYSFVSYKYHCRCSSCCTIRPFASTKIRSSDAASAAVFVASTAVVDAVATTTIATKK